MAEPTPPEATTTPKPTEKAPSKVKIICTTDKQPWTEGGPLAEGDEALVSPEVAVMLIKNKHAVKA